MKIIKLGNEAREGLKKGIDAVADILKTTLGPHGKNSTIGRVALGPLTTNDGVTIAKHIELEDEVENLGVQVIRQVTLETDRDAGDGTTTSAVIAQKLAGTCFDRLGSDSLLNSTESQIGLMRDISTALDQTLLEIDKKTKKVKSKKTLQDIAFTSVEDKKVGDLIADIVWQTGEHGSVLFQESKSRDITGEVIDGYTLDVGYASLYFGKGGFAEVINPLIFTTNGVIDSREKLAAPIHEAVGKEEKRSLIVIAKDFSDQMINEMVATKLKGHMDIYAIQVPNEDKIRDISAVVGSKFIDANLDPALKVTREDLGSCERTVIDIQKSLFLEGKGDTSDRVKELESQKGDNEAINEQLNTRIAELNGKSGVIKVGANSETEKDYWLLKVEDAISATQSALKEGVVKGGGLTLKEIGEKNNTILSDALQAPYNQIQENAGGGLEIPDTVLDPVNVTKTALSRACSVVGTLITTDSVIVDKNENNKNEDN